MRSDQVSNVESYIATLYAQETELHQIARKNSEALGLSQISIGATEGKLIATLIGLHQSKSFVEIGTLTGYSALWIASSLTADGVLFTIEKNPQHVEFSKQIFPLYKGSQKIKLFEGDAQERLKGLSVLGPFDGVFIDGNKSAYIEYLQWAERSIRKGGLIIADNTLLGGSVVTGESSKFSQKQIEIMRTFNARLADSNLYTSLLFPTHEGLTISIKNF